MNTEQKCRIVLHSWSCWTLGPKAGYGNWEHSSYRITKLEGSQGKGGLEPDSTHEEA